MLSKEPQNLYAKQPATEWFHTVVLVVYQRCRALMRSLFSMFLSCLYHSVYRVSSILFAMYSILLMTYLIVGAAIPPSDQNKTDLIAIKLFQIILQTVIEFSILSIFISRLFKLVISQCGHGTPRQFTESLHNRTQDSKISIEPDIHDQDVAGRLIYKATLRSIPKTPLTVGSDTRGTNNTSAWIYLIARPSDTNINDINNNNGDNNVTNESTIDNDNNTDCNKNTRVIKKHSKTSCNGLIFGI